MRKETFVVKRKEIRNNRRSSTKTCRGLFFYNTSVLDKCLSPNGRGCFQDTQRNFLFISANTSIKMRMTEEKCRLEDDGYNIFVFDLRDIFRPFTTSYLLYIQASSKSKYNLDLSMTRQKSCAIIYIFIRSKIFCLLSKSN